MKRKILIVEDNISLSQMQKDWFAQAGYDAVTAMNEPVARSLIRKTTFDLILSDVRLPEGDGISLLEWLRKEKRDIPFIITTEYVSVSDVVRTIKLGAIDYLPKPVHREHLLELAEDVFRPMVTVRKKEKVLFHRTSPKIERVEKYARLVAPSEMAVMILGANGTGKESVAQGIHQGSERWNKPFVAVNCGALPRELAASLLFGHEKGSFTGAIGESEGYFGTADGGTIFLDEVGELPIATQARLLRVLETGEYIRVGGQKIMKTNVRIVAATNVNMRKAISEGKFREDLYYRLNTIPIQMPPLRERGQDIPLLFRLFALQTAEKYKLPKITLTDKAKLLLMQYKWPGNVRQLKNITEQISVLSEKREIDAETLSQFIPQDPESTELATIENTGKHSYESERELLYKVLYELRGNVTELKQEIDALKKQLGEHGAMTAQQYGHSLPHIANGQMATVQAEDAVAEEIKNEPAEPMTREEHDKKEIMEALEKANGRRREAAIALGISDRTLYRRLKQYGLD